MVYFWRKQGQIELKKREKKRGKLKLRKGARKGEGRVQAKAQAGFGSSSPADLQKSPS